VNAITEIRPTEIIQSAEKFEILSAGQAPEEASLLVKDEADRFSSVRTVVDCAESINDDVSLGWDDQAAYELQQRCFARAVWRVLYESQPVFREVVDRCDELVRPHLPRSLRSVMYPPAGETTPLDETEYTHVAMFALQYGLAQL
jgi:hypothetical protein